MYNHKSSSFWLIDTVGWVIWSVKIVPDMTYNVFGGTLNPTQLNSQCILPFLDRGSCSGIKLGNYGLS